MKKDCIIGKIKEISASSDKFLDRKIRETNLPILTNHIPLFYILPSEGEGMLFNELSQKWDISKSSLSEIIVKYERLGFVRRCACEHDKRTVRLTLTKEACSIKQQLIEFDTEFLNVLLEEFDAEQRNLLEECVDKALHNSYKI